MGNKLVCKKNVKIEKVHYKVGDEVEVKDKTLEKQLIKGKLIGTERERGEAKEEETDKIPEKKEEGKKGKKK